MKFARADRKAMVEEANGKGSTPSHSSPSHSRTPSVGAEGFRPPVSQQAKKWRAATFVINATRRFRHPGGYQPTLSRQGPRQLSRRTSFTSEETEEELLIKRMKSNAEQLVPELPNGYGITQHQLVSLLELPQELEKVVEVGGAERVAKMLKVDTEMGLPDETKHAAELDARAAVFGRNMYPEQPFKPFWDATLMILVACAAAALVTGMVIEGAEKGWYDGVGIWMAIALVVLVTAVNDYKQDLQFRALDKENKNLKVNVLRGGIRHEISIFQVQVGEVVMLATGDQVCADGLVLTAESLEIDESTMTGESDLLKKDKHLRPFLLSGTKVADGYGTMLVTAVGQQTEWGKLMASGQDPEEAAGKIAKLDAMKTAGTITEEEYDKQREAVEAEAEMTHGETPLQVRLNGLANNIGRVGASVALIVLLVLVIQFCVEGKYEDGAAESANILIGYLMIAVTIVVVAVPEGLPLAVTLSLAYSMKKMMNDMALVRHLSACETMGGATNICSDKTGTLTTNKMTVVRSWVLGVQRTQEDQEAGETSALLPEMGRYLLFQSMFANAEGEVYFKDDEGKALDTPVVTGKPTEVALLQYGLSLGGIPEEAKAKVEVLKVDPFNSAKKRMGCAVQESSTVRVHWKGASEIVLGLCNRKMGADGAVTLLAAADRAELEALILAMAEQSLRTICFAYADLPAGARVSSDTDLPDTGLVCLAIVGIKDPCRPGVPEAVARCQRAGITVRMVTGDNVVTAKAIARECNILTADGEAVEGKEFRTMTYAERIKRFGPKLEKLQVMARSSPTDKYDLVHMLRGLGEVVGVTGDGTNDARALKEADIGLAMGIAGTEVAKKCSDIVVLDDNFATIVTVVRWGRSVYSNIQKFVQFQLTVNLVALSLNFVAAVSGEHVPLTVVQLLWVNMIMDTMGALALATEPPREELMQQPPYGRHAPLITSPMWRNILGQYVYQIVVLLGYLYEGTKIFGLDHATGECNQPAGAEEGSCTDWVAWDHAKLEEEDEKMHTVLNTIIFNTFVFCQVFNEINARHMERLNVFDGFFNNNIFMSVIVITAAFQAILVEVPVFNNFADTTSLTAVQWGVCIVMGAISIPLAVVVKLLPFPDTDKLEQLQESYLSMLTREDRTSTAEIMSQLRDAEQALEQEKEKNEELARKLRAEEAHARLQEKEIAFLKDRVEALDPKSPSQPASFNDKI